jgi:hypothetical protein
MNVEYPQNYPGQTRDIETSAYVGYHDRGDRWSWTVSVGRYMYPDASDYDYGEWSGERGFRDRVSIRLRTTTSTTRAEPRR